MSAPFAIPGMVSSIHTCDFGLPASSIIRPRDDREPRRRSHRPYPGNLLRRVLDTISRNLALRLAAP